jgi:hypothetical protein
MINKKHGIEFYKMTYQEYLAYGASLNDPSRGDDRIKVTPMDEEQWEVFRQEKLLELQNSAKISVMDEFKEVLARNEKVILFSDSDEFPNTHFLDNVTVMRQCEMLLDYPSIFFVKSKYKVFHCMGHNAKHSELFNFMLKGQGYTDRGATLVLYKNGAEIARGYDMFLKHDDSAERLKEWITKIYFYSMTYGEYLHHCASSPKCIEPLSEEGWEKSKQKYGKGDKDK